MTDERRLVDRVLDAGYAPDLRDRPIEELRRMRDDCKEAENELSFERRLCQARIDILSAEIDRRTGKGDETLIDRLPQILASEMGSSSSPLPSRAPSFAIPRSADVPRRRVEEIVGEQTLGRLSKLSTEELRGIISSLDAYEKTVSSKRRKVHEVMDRIQGEIVRRYSSGEADPAAALGR